MNMAPLLSVAACILSYVWLFATLWTIAHQAPLSMGFARQEYWSRSPFPPPGDLPNPGIEHVSPVSPILAGRFFTSWAREVIGGRDLAMKLCTCRSLPRRWQYRVEGPGLILAPSFTTLVKSQKLSMHQFSFLQNKDKLMGLLWD